MPKRGVADCALARTDDAVPGSILRIVSTPADDDDD
jgi:hypothetical protein